MTCDLQRASQEINIKGWHLTKDCDCQNTVHAFRNGHEKVYLMCICLNVRLNAEKLIM